MFDAERKREFRSFPLPTESQSIVQEGELLLFSHENGNLMYYDQKGVKTQFDIPCSGTLKKSQEGRKEIFLSNYNNGQITVFGKFGTLLGKVPLDFSNVENWDVFYVNNKTYVTGIDGLENNVYLYDLDGSNLLDKPLEGSTKSMINLCDNVLTLTTIVDNYLIQYKINR
jgi:hypothetical protein